MKKKPMLCLVAQACLILCNSMDYGLPGSSVYGILQAKILEWVAISSSRGSFKSRDRTQVSCMAGGFFTIWATREAHICLLFIDKERRYLIPAPGGWNDFTPQLVKGGGDMAINKDPNSCCVWSTWRRRWHPTPVLVPGKSHGWRNLVGCSPPGR